MEAKAARRQVARVEETRLAAGILSLIAVVVFLAACGDVHYSDSEGSRRRRRQARDRMMLRDAGR
jgi:hypothetical protein